MSRGPLFSHRNWQNNLAPEWRRDRVYVAGGWWVGWTAGVPLRWCWHCCHTGPNAGKREPVREEKRAKTNRGKTKKHKNHQDTRLPPLRPWHKHSLLPVLSGKCYFLTSWPLYTLILISVHHQGKKSIHSINSRAWYNTALLKNLIKRYKCLCLSVQPKT